MKGKKFCLLFLILILATSNVRLIESASSQSMPTLSVPEVSIKQIDQSYDVAPSTTTNPYTGEPTTDPGYHVSKLSLVVTIKNQPFTPTTVNGNTTGLFYNVEAKANKPHYTSGADSYNQYAVRASSNDYTVITIYLGNGEGGTWEISRGTQVNIRIQAVIGYSNFVWGSGLLPSGSDFTLLSAGDWSGTQTLTIGEGDTTPEPTAVPPTLTPTGTASTQVPTETPSQAISETSAVLGLSWEQIAIAVMAIVIVVLIGLVIFSRKLRK